MAELDRKPGATPAPIGEGLQGAMAAQGDAGGGGGQFQAAADGQLLCLTCRQTSDAAEQAAEDVRRVEGASDPADMALVTPVRCPHCGTTGSLVLRYGPEASEEEADLLVRLPRRGDGGGA